MNDTQSVGTGTNNNNFFATRSHCLYHDISRQYPLPSGIMKRSGFLRTSCSIYECHETSDAIETNTGFVDESIDRPRSRAVSWIFDKSNSTRRKITSKSHNILILFEGSLVSHDIERI
jgi:hypothetical protein